MILKKIIFSNFRQFYGEQKLEFANGEKNITIIFGENGKGKTGIFRGLIFSIFGDRYLGQDNKQEKIHLVNLRIIDENSEGIGEAKVTTTFEHEGLEYTISREILASKRNNEISERDGDISLNIIDKNGNNLEPITNERIINEKINNIIHKDVKEFFFFDGEKIDTFAKTDKGIRSEVKKGIIKLLNIESIDEATSLISNLKSKEKRRIMSESANNNLIKITKDIEGGQSKLENFSLKEEENQREIDLCEKEIEINSEKLLENNEIKNIQNKINNIQDKIIEKDKMIDVLKVSIRDKSLKQLSPLLLETEFIIATNFLQNNVSKKVNIADIAILNKIFSDQKCICGTDLKENKVAYDTIYNLIKNHKKSFTRELNSIISETYEDIKKEKDKTLSSYDSFRRQLRLEYDTLEELRIQKDREEKIIKALAKNTIDLGLIEKTLENNKEDLSNLREQAINIKSEMKSLKNQLEKLQKKSEEAINQDSSLKFDRKKLDNLELLHINFKRLLNSYTVEMRERLINETTNMFKMLIDSKDKDLISKIDINENYELDFYNWNNFKINQEISKGQRQVVALSFITSLAKLSSKNDEINFPLFMDTPFGRMSGNNRDNIIKNIPNLTSQWVPLLTDTELSVTEEMKFEEYGKVGKKYILEQLEEGKAHIVEVDINKAISKRR